MLLFAVLVTSMSITLMQYAWFFKSNSVEPEHGLPHFSSHDAKPASMIALSMTADPARYKSSCKNLWCL